jgi:hypothetical protein
MLKLQEPLTILKSNIKSLLVREAKISVTVKFLKNKNMKNPKK